MPRPIDTKQPKRRKFWRSAEYREQVNPDNIRGIRGAVLASLKRFLDTKRENPRQPYGRRDTPFSPEGEIGRAVPGMWHAHLNFDLSICYRVQGEEIYLYGIYSHNDLGTNQPPNRQKQRSMGQRFANMTFTEE